MSATTVPRLTRVECSLCGAGNSRHENTVAGFALERCRTCGFVFMNPRYCNEALEGLYTQKKDVAALIEHYDKIASPATIAQYNLRLDFIERHMPGRGRLLDFACAAGHFFEQAAKRGWEAHGVDIGEWTQEAASVRGLANMHVGYLNDIAFSDEYFDVVHAAQVFEHLESPREALKEIRRILRPGGLLYVDVPNYRTLPIMLNKDDFMLNAPPQHINFFTPGTLSAMLSSADFKDIRIHTSGGLKWENLLGIKTQNALIDPHKKETPAITIDAPQGRIPSRFSGLRGTMKKAVMAGFVKPVLYDWSKLGMLLIGVARR
jgi:2-polyprenyl-3-methyl-5-hydroxy-6-metoxy-1,4-benzoquinol methylase